jgi:HD-like signal output (HDOD) protein
MLSMTELFAKAGTLPTMPEVARKLLATFDDEDIDLRSIVADLSRDPVLSAKVLRLANSARYGLSRRVETIDGAAALLGTDALRTLVVSGGLIDTFPRAPGLDRISFWEHSLASGGYARWLARPAGVDPEVAFLAGFTVRIGQLLLAQVVPAAIAAVENGLDRMGQRRERELALIGVSHALASAELARRWEFPVPLVVAFAHADTPLATDPFSRLAAVVCLATRLADAGEFDLPLDEMLDQLPADVCAALALDTGGWPDTLPPYDALADAAKALG